MKITSIYFIINPFAGQERPAVNYIDKIFADSSFTLTVYELKKEDKASEIARKQIGKYDVIAAYGGDGIVTEIGSALIGTNIVLAIIPAGTANVMGKELGIPQDPEEALKLIRDGQFRVRTIDTGLVNGKAFLLRVNLGIMAEMITETDPELKDRFGQLAYGLSAFKTVSQAEPVKYNLKIDGKTEDVQGVSLTVTNSGNIGIGDLQMYPGINIGDGLLDILLLQDAGPISLIKVAGSSLLNQETDAIKHWSCCEVTITMDKHHTFLCDDTEDKARLLSIKTIPSSLSVLVPVDKI